MIKTKTMNRMSTLLVIAACSIFASCHDPKADETTANESAKDSVSIKEEAISFQMDSTTSNSFVVYNNNNKPKPVVLVIHEWWGLNDYPKQRARQLADLGYLAMAVDMFGNGKVVDNPGDAQNMATPFYQNPQMAYSRLQAVLAKVKTLPQADTSKIAAIGYCFGGGVLLNSARLGAQLDGVVSFHGSLLGTPFKKDLLKSNILVCHGAVDPFVPEKEVAAFKKAMDSINATYTFKAYPDATHAFTNPKATEVGQKFKIPISYNAAADTASWNDMKQFLGNVLK